MEPLDPGGKLRRAGFLCAAQTAEANAKVGLGALEAGVAPESRQPSGTLFAVPPSQGHSLALNFPAALLLCVRTDDGDRRPAAVQSLCTSPWDLWSKVPRGGPR